MATEHLQTPPASPRPDAPLTPITAAPRPARDPDPEHRALERAHRPLAGLQRGLRTRRHVPHLPVDVLRGFGPAGRRDELRSSVPHGRRHRPVLRPHRRADYLRARQRSQFRRPARDARHGPHPPRLPPGGSAAAALLLDRHHRRHRHGGPRLRHARWRRPGDLRLRPQHVAGHGRTDRRDAGRRGDRRGGQAPGRRHDRWPSGWPSSGPC